MIALALSLFVETRAFWPGGRCVLSTAAKQSHAYGKSGRPRGQGRPVRRVVCDGSLALVKRKTATGRVRRHRTPQHDDSQPGRNFLDPNALTLRDVTIWRNGLRRGLDY